MFDLIFKKKDQKLNVILFSIFIHFPCISHISRKPTQSINPNSNIMSGFPGAEGISKTEISMTHCI